MRDYSFGNYLGELRKRRGLSQVQLGALVGVSNKAVSKWENGVSKPQTSTLVKLSSALGVTLEELLASKSDYAQSSEKGVFAMNNETWKKAQEKLKEKYGSNPPLEIVNRFESEKAELLCNDNIMYIDLVARIVEEARKEHAHVQVRSLTSSSFIAFLLGATIINPLPPHYYCPNCKKVEFVDNVYDGWDLEPKKCTCGFSMHRSGHNIPFEVYRKDILRPDAYFELSIGASFFERFNDLIFELYDKERILPIRVGPIGTMKKDGSMEECYIKKYLFIKQPVANLPLPDEIVSPEDYFNKYRDYPVINALEIDYLDNFHQYEEKANYLPDDMDYLKPEILDSFIKKNTADIVDFGKNTADSDKTNEIMNEFKIKHFSDIAILGGLKHGTGVWNEDVKRIIKRDDYKSSDIPIFRDDVFLKVMDALKKNGIYESGFAFKIMRAAEFGHYLRFGMAIETKMNLEKIGIDDKYIDMLCKINYSFPKSHCFTFAKMAFIQMWYKVNGYMD